MAHTGRTNSYEQPGLHWAIPAQQWHIRIIPRVMDNLGNTALYRHITVTHPGRTNSFGQSGLQWDIPAWNVLHPGRTIMENLYNTGLYRHKPGHTRTVPVVMDNLGYTGFYLHKLGHTRAAPTVVDNLGYNGLYRHITVAHPGRTNSYGQLGKHQAMPAQPWHIRTVPTVMDTLGYTGLNRHSRGTSGPCKQLWITWVILDYTGI